MPKFKKETSYGIFKTSYKSSILQNDISVDDIPIGNITSVNTLFAEQPQYEFINQILLGENHKASEGWSDVVLTQAWAKSFAEAVNKRPGPLYLQGHEDAESYKMRQIPAGYIVGAKLDEAYENGAGRLLLRNRLFESGKFSKEIVEQTLREINAGVLNTSTGDYERREYRYDEPSDTIVSFAVESIKNQTNAIVEADMNASDASIITSSFKYTPCDKDGNEIGKPVDCTSIRSDLKINQGEDSMTKEEMLTLVRTMHKEGTVTSEDLANVLGVQLMNDEVNTNVAAFKEVKALLGDTDIKEFVTTALKQKKDAVEQAFNTLKETKLSAAFSDKLECNLARVMFSVKEGDEASVDAEIARIQSLDAMKELHESALYRMNYTPSAGGSGENKEPSNEGVTEA